LFCKGAPESVIERCRYTLTARGEVVPLTAADRDALETRVNDLACEPLRTLAFAFRVSGLMITDLSLSESGSQ
jgi:magnesium-transporting ATPase (P-type)